MKNRKTFVDGLKKVLGISKKIGDADLSAELEAAIAQLQAALDTLPQDAAPEEVDALKAQIAELQAKLDALPVADDKKGDADPKDDEIATLKARVAELEAENAALKEAQAKEGAVADAASRFPQVKVGDAKNERAVYTAVLADAKVFTDARLQGMSDAEIRSAYAGLCAAQAKPTIGKKLLGDAKPATPVDLNKKFGGKK